MSGIRRWWKQYGLGVATSSLVLLSAWGIRQTQGAWLAETYRWATQIWHPVVDYQTVIAQSASQELRAQVAELQNQNRQLRQLLDFSEQIEGEGIPAAVIGRGADQWWQQATLSRGSNHGVKTGDVVMAPGGLVGRVQHITPNTSRVLLISDPTSRVGVMLSRSRQMGVLRGTGSQMAVLEFFDKEPSVEVGDTIVTSGLSSLYPAGVVVGKVRAVDLDASPAPQAVIELSAPLGLLEWGLIYSYAQSTEPTL
ncbi:MAG: rod shape-determining protein MreC [Cyanophyceae cyanobacterium]